MKARVNSVYGLYFFSVYFFLDFVHHPNYNIINYKVSESGGGGGPDLDDV
jgi:hypothetical protein